MQENTLIQAPNTIYHYCGLNAFKSIIEQKQLWMTDINKSNDYMEIKWFLYKLVEHYNQNYIGLNPNYHEDEQRVVLKHIEEDKNIFVTCFSEEPDLLSQWRAYADNGQGVAIGFDTSNFNYMNEVSNNIIKFNKINYELDAQKTKADEIIKLNLEKYIDMPGDLFGQPAALLYSCLQAEEFTTFFKNKMFKEENEWRLAVRFFNDGLSNGLDLRIIKINPVKYYCKSDELVPYCSLDFSELYHPINKLIIGPKCKMSISDVKLFLIINGFTNFDDHSIEIIKSSVTYR